MLLTVGLFSFSVRTGFTTSWFWLFVTTCQGPLSGFFLQHLHSPRLSSVVGDRHAVRQWNSHLSGLDNRLLSAGWGFNISFYLSTPACVYLTPSLYVFWEYAQLEKSNPRGISLIQRFQCRVPVWFLVRELRSCIHMVQPKINKFLKSSQASDPADWEGSGWRDWHQEDVTSVPWWPVQHGPPLLGSGHISGSSHGTSGLLVRDTPSPHHHHQLLSSPGHMHDLNHLISSLCFHVSCKANRIW